MNGLEVRDETSRGSVMLSGEMLAPGNDGERQTGPQLGILYGLHFLNDGLQASFLLLLPFIALDVGLSEMQVGEVSAVHFLVGALLSAPATLLVRLRDGNKLLMAVMAFCGVCTAGAALASTFWLALGVYLVAGAGFGLFHPVAFSRIARSVPVRSASRAMGLFTAVGDVGRVAAVAGVMLLLPLVAWQPVAIGLGVPVTIASLVLLALCRPGNQKPDPGQVRERPLGTVASPVRQPWFWMLQGVGFLDALANSSLYLFLPFLLLAKGCDQVELSVLVGLYFVAGLSGRFVAGAFADRFGRSASLIICQTAIGLTMAGLCTSGLIIWIGVWVMLLGLFSRGCLPIILSVTAERLPRETTRMGFAIHQTVLGVATFLSPLFLGLVADAASTTTAFGCAGGLCGLNAVAALALRRRLAKVHPVPSTS